MDKKTKYIAISLVAVVGLARLGFFTPTRVASVLNINESISPQTLQRAQHLGSHALAGYKQATNLWREAEKVRQYAFKRLLVATVLKRDPADAHCLLDEARIAVDQLDYRVAKELNGVYAARKKAISDAYEAQYEALLLSQDQRKEVVGAQQGVDNARQQLQAKVELLNRVKQSLFSTEEDIEYAQDGVTLGQLHVELACRELAQLEGDVGIARQALEVPDALHRLLSERVQGLEEANRQRKAFFAKRLYKEGITLMEAQVNPQKFLKYR